MTGAPPIRTILVAGGGIVGFSAALAFARALPQARVQLLELPVAPNALADRLPGTLPATRHFHRLVGIDEPILVRRAGATFRIGTRFENWPPGEGGWLHCFGRHGAAVDRTAFPHQWVRLRSEGRALDFSDYAPAAALARANKFVHPSDDPASLLSTFDYALRLEPEAYLDLLRDAAVQARVAIRPASLAGVDSQAGKISSLRTGDGSEMRADLFIDCAGPDAPLLTSVEDEFIDWSEWLPLSYLVVGEGATEAGPLDIATATGDGYVLDIPMRSRSIRIAASIDEQDPAAGQPLLLRPGRRRASWVGNVVAFGDSSVAVDPLESSNLFLAQSAIRRAISLLPAADFHPLVLREFNRRTAAEADRVRDFIAAHYFASSTRAGRFWSTLADRRPPESLAHTLDQFRHRGRLPKYEEESFDDDSWYATLFGLGLVPQRVDPAAYRVDSGRAGEMLDHMASVNAALPQPLPDYRDYLDHLISG